MQTVSTADLETLAAMAVEGALRPALGLRLVGIDEIPDSLAGHFDAHRGEGGAGGARCWGKTIWTNYFYR